MNRYWTLVFLFLSGSIAGITFLVIREGLLSFLEKKNIAIKNYAGNKVLNCGGILLLIPFMLASLPFFLLRPTPIQALFLLVSPILAFVGMLDDVLGDSSSKGLIGHMKKFLKGGFSTGFLKAIMGILLGFLLAWTNYGSWYIMILNVFLFALSVNVINLLDLRPGRAIKGFGIFLLTIVFIAGFKELQYVIPVMVLLLFYTGGELKENYMLGDTGANLLGGILGFYGVTVLLPHVKFIMLLLLCSIQIFSEFGSISKLVEQIPLLKKFDMLGRRQERS